MEKFTGGNAADFSRKSGALLRYIILVGYPMLPNTYNSGFPGYQS
jgi:hypothetical protein